MNCHSVFNCVGHNHKLTDNRLIKETVLKYINEAEFKELFTIAALDKIEDVTSKAVVATTETIKATMEARNIVNNLTNQTVDFVNDAINNTAVEGGILSSAFVTVEEQLIGEGPISLRERNSKTTINVNSISELLKVKPTQVQGVFVKGLQGGMFLYDNSKSAINDGGLIFNGWVRDIRDKHITPEMFGAKPNDTSFDSTEALNKAFASGFNLYGSNKDTYYVTKAIISKGQSTIGGWKISTRKTTARDYLYIKTVNTVTNYNTDMNVIRSMMSDGVFDLVELLDIKSLGFNIVYHYLDFGASYAENSGTIAKLLNNAQTAGIKLIIGIHSNTEAKDLGAVEFTRKYESHSAVWGIAVRDEPAYWQFATNGEINQQAEIDALRAVTKKPLVTTEFKATWYRRFMPVNGYDYIFVNSYAYADSTLEQDLNTVRRNFTAIQDMYPNSKVIPCVGLFRHFKDGSAVYATDINKIVNVAENLILAGDGSYSCFIWDNAFSNKENSVRDTPAFYNLLQKAKDAAYKNKTGGFYRFGCNGDWNKQVDSDANGDFNTLLVKHQDMGEMSILKHLIPTYPDADKFAYKATHNMYPLKITGSSRDNDRESTKVATYISGIALKQKEGQLITTIPLRKFLQFDINYKRLGYSDVNTTNLVLNIGYTTDGTTVTPLKTVTSNTLTNEFIDTVVVQNPTDKYLALSFTNDVSDDNDLNFVHVLYGMFLTSDW